MSFSFSFFSTSRQAAKDKLRRAYAPLSLKAMIEHSIDLLRWPQEGTTDTHGRTSDSEKARAGQGSANMVPSSPTLCGVFVQADGHFDDTGASGSWINLLKVSPVYE